MTPDDPAGDLPTKPHPQEPGAAAPDPGPTEPIIAPHVPVADLSTAPLAPAGAPVAARGPSRLGMWALVGMIALLGIAVIVIGTLWLQSNDPAPVSTGTPTPSVSVTPSATPTDDGDDDAPPSEAPVDPGPAPTTPPEPTEPPDPDPTGTPAAPAG